MRMLLAVVTALALPATGHAAEARVEQARALLAARDCDLLLLSFENAKPGPDAAELARVLAEAASGPCTSDRIVAFSLSGAARRLAPRDVEVLMAAATGAREAGMAGEAQSALDAAIEAAPADPRPRLARARLALDEGEPALALEVLGPVRSAPGAKELLAVAAKAQKDAEEGKRRLYRDEKTALDAAAKAKALEAKPSRARPEAAAAEEPGDGPPGGERQVAQESYTLTGSGRTRVGLSTRAGRTYRVRVEGSCWREGSEVQRKVSADLRFRCGEYVHGMAVDKLSPSTDGFDFVAGEGGLDAEIWNADTRSASITCQGTLTVSER